MSKENREVIIYLTPDATVRKIRTVQKEGDALRKIGISDFSTKPTNYYNLDVIIPKGVNP